MAHPWAKALDQHGLVVLPGFVKPEQLCDMQRAFACRLRRQRWNDIDGYEKTERYRHMIQDVLTLAQGFVDCALHPDVKCAVREYVGPAFALVEAKGWLSLPTRRDFHGWHGDAWYDQRKVSDHIPREVKLGLYLTDVTSGAFTYIKGSHGRQAPRTVRAEELAAVSPEQIMQVLGPAGTAFLFDTSGIHRQSAPILEPRQAVFYGYHDPAVPLQAEDVAYNRYHPLRLNAAFLGGLDDEDRRILGFGDKTNHLPCHQRQTEHPGFHGLICWAYDVKLLLRQYRQRVAGKLGKLLGRK
jgi:hypothetical protein